MKIKIWFEFEFTLFACVDNKISTYAFVWHCQQSNISDFIKSVFHNESFLIVIDENKPNILKQWKYLSANHAISNAKLIFLKNVLCTAWTLVACFYRNRIELYILNTNCAHISLCGMFLSLRIRFKSFRGGALSFFKSYKFQLLL